MTCGSESVHNKNIIVRRLRLDGVWQLIHLKLRPDTPQLYEDILIEDVRGSLTGSFININPWTQFFDLKGRTDKPMSKVQNIQIKNCHCSCGYFFNVSKNEEQYHLSNFTLNDISVCAKIKDNDYTAVENLIMENVTVE